MQIAFILYKFFPYGGLQRDFLRIARVLAELGHQVRVYTMAWEGAREPGFDIRVRRPFAITGHGRNQRFIDWLQADLAEDPVDVVVGFNKMPGLDLYYAADGCFVAKAEKQRGAWYRYSRRYRYFSGYEQAVFARGQRTEILMISEVQRPLFEQYYGTEAERFVLLPPGIARDRRAPINSDEIRASFREEFGLGDDDRLVLMVGSGFRTKGLDRSINALASLPEAQRQRTQLFVIGQDDPKRFQLQAKALGVSDRLRFFAGRDDVPRFLQGADLLIHPAYNENTGTVLLEALVAGLPVLCSDVCGYARYISDADAGELVQMPFKQQQLSRLLSEMLDSPRLVEWRKNGLAYADVADLYSLPERAAERIIACGQRKGSC